MRSSTAATLLAFVLSATALPTYEWQELSARTGGTCTGPASTLTGEECAKAPQAQGFMYNGECLSLKMAGGSVHKHQSGQCHKNIGGGAAASGSGSHATTTRSRPRDVDWQELSARTGGTCTGPASSLTGEECAKAPQAQGFMYNGECLSLKMAGGSVHKHQTGQCHKNIGGGGAAASGSGSHTTTRSRPRSYDIDEIIMDIAARALDNLEWQELSARTGGTCTGPASSLTGEECAKAPQAQGFMYNGECLSLKMAGGSVHKHQTGQCHKNIGGGGAAASGSGSHATTTRSRPRDVDSLEWQELSARTGGTCTGPASSLTGEECAKAPQAQGFMYNGECLSLKMAGGSVHKHQTGQCHKNIGGGGAAASGSGSHGTTRSRPRAVDSYELQELSARTGGTCTGPASTLTGEECAKAPQAQGFMYNGECLSLKMAGGSVHKHQTGQCHKNIGGGASGSGTHSATRSHPRSYDVEDIVNDIVARAADLQSELEARRSAW